MKNLENLSRKNARRYSIYLKKSSKKAINKIKKSSEIIKVGLSNLYFAITNVHPIDSLID